MTFQRLLSLHLYFCTFSLPGQRMWLFFSVMLIGPLRAMYCGCWLTWKRRGRLCACLSVCVLRNKEASGHWICLYVCECYVLWRQTHKSTAICEQRSLKIGHAGAPISPFSPAFCLFFFSALRTVKVPASNYGFIFASLFLLSFLLSFCMGSFYLTTPLPVVAMTTLQCAGMLTVALVT